MLHVNSRKEVEQFLSQHIINTTEALENLGCSRQYLNKLVYTGYIKPLQDFSRNRLFLREQNEKMNSKI